MYYNNGLEALRGIIKAVSAEEHYLQKQLERVLARIDEGKGEPCYAEAYQLCLESIMQLQHELEAIRMSAKRTYNTPF